MVSIKYLLRPDIASFSSHITLCVFGYSYIVDQDQEIAGPTRLMLCILKSIIIIVVIVILIIALVECHTYKFQRH